MIVIAGILMIASIFVYASELSNRRALTIALVVSAGILIILGS